MDAFWPAWGRLDELKSILPRTTRWACFSATFPPHILKTVKEKLLLPSHVHIQQTSNRPNTTYATHQVLNSIDDLRNYECFLSTPFNLETQPRVLIFVDNRDLSCRIARYLDSRLPVIQRKKGFVLHYHSSMSGDYLTRAHNSYTELHGMCRIMVATSGQSVVCLGLFPHSLLI